MRLEPRYPGSGGITATQHTGISRGIFGGCCAGCANALRRRARGSAPAARRSLGFAKKNLGFAKKKFRVCEIFVLISNLL
jgi:hypothetical protein